ncbi:MAG TPA: hypothetical protein VGE38_02415 [Nocardioides sp.]|uniref:hypothetical protein n=1 Tax=Nocardioides sp. TaxID=35761 RepID=UPI002ED8D96C
MTKRAIRIAIAVAAFVGYAELPEPWSSVALFAFVVCVLGLLGIGRVAPRQKRPDDRPTTIVVASAGNRPIEVVKVFREYTDTPASDLIRQLKSTPALVDVSVAAAEVGDLIARLERHGAEVDAIPGTHRR